MNEALFSPLQIRGLNLANRLVMSPMCQYSAVDGFPGDWHLIHYGTRAQGGVGLILLEATAVTAEGRISPADLGLWKDEQTPSFRKLADLIHTWGSKAGVQIAHAGRKASTKVPWEGSGAVKDGGWPVVGSSPLKFHEDYLLPHELTHEEIRGVVSAFARTAERVLEAGFDVVEVHAAHGYLINQFLSPLSNKRTDEYGGSFDNRVRFLEEVVSEIRRVWPVENALFVRLSGSDWVEGGWTIEDAERAAGRLKTLGVDVIDVSSGGLMPTASIPVGPGYQVPFSERVRKSSGLAVGAVGLITEISQAEEILEGGKADLVFLGRLLLRDPFWPARHAPKESRRIPRQYLRAFPLA